MIEREAAGYDLQFTRDGGGRGKLEVRRDGGLVHLDRLDPTSAQRRSSVLGELPESDRPEVERALLEIAEEAAGDPARENGAAPPVLEEAGREIVHPAVAVRRDFLLYGFRTEQVVDGRVEEVPVRVLSERTDSGLTLRTVETEEFTVGDRQFVVDPRWRPPLLEDNWSRAGVRELLTGESDPPAPGACYREVRETLRRYVDFPDEGAYPILSAFVLLSYVARAYTAVPYIGLLGPKGTAKSQTLALLDRLCLNSYKGRITAAGLGDTTSALRGTVLIDQAHQLSEELVDLLVDGYRRDGGRRRLVDVDNRGEPHEFETFGPKALASADGVDPDLEDRLIVIHTAPASRPVEQLPAAEGEFRDLRSDLYASALDFWPLYADRAAELETERIKTRGEELWRPVRSVLQVANAPDADLEAARELYRRSVVETTAELGDWELALLDEVATLFQGTDVEEAEIENTELRDAVLHRLGLEGADDQPRPGVRWVGSQLDRLNVLDGNERRREDGERRRFYQFTRDRVAGQLGRFGVDPDWVSGPSGPPGNGSGQPAGRSDGGAEGPSGRPDQIEGEDEGGGGCAECGARIGPTSTRCARCKYGDEGAA